MHTLGIQPKLTISFNQLKKNKTGVFGRTVMTSPKNGLDANDLTGLFE